MHIAFVPSTIVLNPPPLKLYEFQKLVLDDIYKFTKGQGYMIENGGRARSPRFRVKKLDSVPYSISI
jgi:hypothetical protein